jgi:2-keto-4-pentenoate hydratase/2-oxohepta-3-ene-1,7-dioic acid hydratase in catechol pathway
MRLGTVVRGGQQTWGALQDNGFVDIGRRLSQYPSLRAALAEIGPQGLTPYLDEPAINPDELEYRPVVPDPAQIFCVGVNYGEHRRETGRQDTRWPTVFLRLPGSQVGHDQPLIKPRESVMFDYEGELAVVIGRAGRRIPVEHALEHILGYSAYNDASARDWQNHTTQWTPGKNFVGTGAFGPFLVTADELPHIGASSLVTLVNGEERQRATINEMTTSIAEVIAYLSTFAALQVGDVICTGTPGGVGSRRNPPVSLQPGDVVEVHIDGLPTLRNGVVGEDA